jgi:lipid II:glycine glycyltransferase (peptidoglycan interpeptide bridge formation enzyme)
VSASRRALFGKPISHALVWEALRHAKHLGCRWFETGEQLYPASGPASPTEKQLGISAFKRGFGGSTHVRLKIRLEDAVKSVQTDGC